MANDLEGRVIVLTGATEGIGKAAAHELARRGATLVLVGRNREKGERLVDELKASSKNANIDLLLGDLSSLADVRSVASAFRQKHDRLHVLVNNAGALFRDHVLSKDGIEMTFALNHMAYFLLTQELLTLLKETPGARIVCTSSDAHRRGHVDIQTIATRPNRRAGFAAYCDSKLANVLFTKELARRLLGTNVSANCFHPGFVHSGFGTNNAGLYGASIALASSLLGRTPERGAQTLLFLATSPGAASFSGDYFHDNVLATTAKAAREEALGKQLWELSERLCGGASA